MKYEKELLSLMSMLKNYLGKIKDTYEGLIDMDDLYQECLLSAVKSSDNPGIKDPKKYFIGVFDRTIKHESCKAIRRFQILNGIELPTEYHEVSVGMVEAIDLSVRTMAPKTRRIWSCLKTFYGNGEMVMEALNCPRTTFYRHKDKLRDLYETIKN